MVHRGPGIYSQINNPASRSRPVNVLGAKLFSLSPHPSRRLSNIASLIRAAYLRVFGRLVYQEELTLLEKGTSQLQDSQISVRDFVRYLAKSSIFRSLYWQPFYLCKAIEYIHNRLLGRPTYGRQEINQYFDIVYKQGYSAFIDSIIDSSEYLETFGDDIVPYERYVTPLALSARLYKSSLAYDLKQPISNIGKFKQLGKSSMSITPCLLQKKIMQGVTSVRDEIVVFQLPPNPTLYCREQVLRAAYRQIFERDISIMNLSIEFASLEKRFLANLISVKALIAQLGVSRLYRKEFYQPYPNTKVIELGTKHFLGRAPKNQQEIRFYNQILASKGLSAFVLMLVSTDEYAVLFGDNVVPYRRFPTLPAANFPNTARLYSLTRQNTDIIVPSFKSLNFK